MAIAGAAALLAVVVGVLRAVSARLAPLPAASTPAQAKRSVPRAVRGPGTVIAQPSITFVTFAGDPLTRSIVTFHQRLASSRYLADAGREYGVSPIRAARHVEVRTPAPSALDDVGVQNWLATELHDGKLLGAPDSNTLYALYFPTDTTIHYGGRVSCRFDGYHGDTQARGHRIAYAVLPRCPPHDADTTELDRLTLVASHEYFEWLTDPFPRTVRAWHFVDSESAAWALAFAAELSDLCFGTRLVPKDLGFMVQSLWSNRAAAEGQSPCQPMERAVFAAPMFVLPDRIRLPARMLDEVLPKDGTVPGVVVAPGTSRGVDFALRSDSAPSGAFRITAQVGGRMVEAQPLTVRITPERARIGEPVSLVFEAFNGFSEPTIALIHTFDDTGIVSRWPLIVAPEHDSS